jgi:hypothetical protein
VLPHHYTTVCIFLQKQFDILLGMSTSGYNESREDEIFVWSVAGIFVGIPFTLSAFYMVVCVVQWVLLRWEGSSRWILEQWEGMSRYRALEDGRGEWSAVAVELEEGERNLAEIEEGERVRDKGVGIQEEQEKDQEEGEGVKLEGKKDQIKGEKEPDTKEDAAKRKERKAARKAREAKRNMLLDQLLKRILEHDRIIGSVGKKDLDIWRCRKPVHCMDVNLVAAQTHLSSDKKYSTSLIHTPVFENNCKRTQATRCQYKILGNAYTPFPFPIPIPTPKILYLQINPSHNTAANVLHNGCPHLHQNPYLPRSSAPQYAPPLVSLNAELTQRQCSAKTRPRDGSTSRVGYRLGFSLLWR